MNHNYDIKPIDIIEFNEFILSIIHDYISNNKNILSSEKYINIITEVIMDILNNTYNELLSKDRLSELIARNIEFYFENVEIPRSYPTSRIINKYSTKKIDELEKHLEYLKNVPQPAQKEDEWYAFRWNHLTASSAWKALEYSQCQKNALILSKCQPIDLNKKKRVNIHSPFHWGHKYEPLSIMFYEKMYNTIIGEFGCIKHKSIEHLAASPDGINIKKNNKRFMRALEVKNPSSNRDINGIPKKDYWVQMQMQMECCDLDECDFLETRFKEYDTEDEFNADGSFNFTKEGKSKGIIVTFYTENGPLYKYAPFQCSKEQYDKWYDNCMEEFSNLTWIRNIYWWLDEHSCVLVPRNKGWFEFVKDDFQKIWDIILKERVTGWDHRKPKKRVKKLNSNNNIIIKIRTESFDESINIIQPN